MPLCRVPSYEYLGMRTFAIKGKRFYIHEVLIEDQEVNIYRPPIGSPTQVEVDVNTGYHNPYHYLMIEKMTQTSRNE